MTEGPKAEVARTFLGPSGACLGSTSGFRRRHGYGFNKNQCVVVGGLNGEMIWYGDIDLARSDRKLQRLANTLGERVELYSESWCWSGAIRSMVLRNEVYEPEDST